MSTEPKLSRAAEDALAEMRSFLDDREQIKAALADAVRERKELRAEIDDLNRQCAHRERVIVALARAAGKFCQVAGPAPGASERDVKAALDALIAALKDPIVAECVAQAEAEADDAEAEPEEAK